MHRNRLLPALAILWSSLGLVAQNTHGQTREQAIDAARAEKEKTLHPETPSHSEELIVRVQDSIPFRLVTGDVNGFGIALGNTTPGSGFAIGPRYRRTDLFDGNLTFSLDAGVAMNQSYQGRFGLALPNLLDRHAAIAFTTTYRNLSEMPYYGPGPDSEKTGRSDYRLEDVNLELRPEIKPFKGLTFGPVGSFLAVNVGPGHSSKYISSEQQYSAGAAPGINEQTNFWLGGGFVEYDWRNIPGAATSGGRYRASYTRYLDRDLGTYSFYRVDLDARQFIPVFNHTRVFALRGASSFTQAGSGQHVPFYLQPMLGGPTSLRGYRINRFYGDNSVLISGEYRWDLSPLGEMAIFADAGKVFNEWSQWNLHHLESDVGFAIRFKQRNRVAFSFETAFSHEGFQIWFRMNDVR